MDLSTEDAAESLIKGPTEGFKSGDMGREFDASGNYLFNDHLVMNVGLGHFSPGTLMVKNVHRAAVLDFRH